MTGNEKTFLFGIVILMTVLAAALPGIAPRDRVWSATVVSDGNDGHRTQSREVYHKGAYTCAVKDGFAPTGTWLRIASAEDAGGPYAWVRVNDRLPAAARSDIDLSPAAAALIFPTGKLSGKVTISREGSR